MLGAMPGEPPRANGPVPAETHASSNRFLAAWTAGAAARQLGWLALLTASVVLSRPLALSLFSPDGEVLGSGVIGALETARLVVALAGAGLLALGLYAPRLERVSLRVRQGTALLAALGLVAAFLLAEAGLRFRNWRDWGSAFATPLPLSSIRPKGGLLLRPGVYGTAVGNDFAPGPRQRVLFTINGYGLRGTLPKVPKPAGIRRVVCLGGSSTFGYTVTDGKEWPARLGELLGPSVDVVNAGRPGSTTWSDFRYLRDRLLRLEPDVVILYEGFNDMWRGIRRHMREQPDYGIVDERLPADEGEALDLGPRRPWPVRLSFVMRQVGDVLEDRLEPPEVRDLPPSAKESFRFDPAIVDLYARNLRAMVRLCHARGVPVAVATFAGCDDPGEGPADQRLRLKYVLDNIPALDLRTAQEGLDLYREITRRVAREERATLLDAALLMPKGKALFSDTIHFTPAGELELARRFAEALGPSSVWTVRGDTGAIGRDSAH